MKDSTPSLTANKVGMMRAAHQLFDNPIVFEDQIALSILGAESISDIRSKKQKFTTRLHSYLRAIVVARSSFAEAELYEAMKRGVSQYVILGAGLDTFAYRNPTCSDSLHVFEIDHPATQEWKRDQLNQADIQIPERLTFVPIDFETQSLANQLKLAGFRTDKLTFFSWLGVTMYLTNDTMMKTMQFITTSTPSGSTIVFDYVVPPSSQSFLRRLVFFLLSKKVKKAGKPWKNFYESNSLMKDLRKIGFTDVQDTGPEEINALFFKNRTDKLLVGNFGHLMKAIV
jgi:methyltransferase (TIGR00027 family)